VAQGGSLADLLRTAASRTEARDGDAPELEVVIEVPRGGFLKRGSSGSIDFVSPLPCPYNYGAVPGLLGQEGDLLDALVLGPRLRYGTRLRLRAWGAVTLSDRGLQDDKLVCSLHAPSAAECEAVLRFFRFYARCKGLLNLWRRRPGRNACEGWCTAQAALARARPLPEDWTEAPVGY
jgi:inorganic pyrophosphatase